MVQYFGEQLNGFVFTQNAWVQSYGSRYAPPLMISPTVLIPLSDMSAHRLLFQTSADLAQ